MFISGGRPFTGGMCAGAVEALSTMKAGKLPHVPWQTKHKLSLGNFKVLKTCWFISISMQGIQDTRRFPET